jgi:hypothetical protein
MKCCRDTSNVKRCPGSLRSSVSSQPDDTVPALRAITLRDVLTFRMGFGRVMAMPDTYPPTILEGSGNETCSKIPCAS